ncbi:hypothetical protein RFI_32848 [Reticulomyxa filosa]|uniref:Uncharacterized protein n=1 Tax=Reticulomyxa filosa TaxID=46433 RepID=X6LSD6_RETFI|nr:hypothetical protein RFI_32848 [Reticulomyxa filosa]|eukprot:ETO04549.1 hypothetical protein RFI_32848 [Reticulomyxa filosa]
MMELIDLLFPCVKFRYNIDFALPFLIELDCTGLQLLIDLLQLLLEFSNSSFTVANIVIAARFHSTHCHYVSQVLSFEIPFSLFSQSLQDFFLLSVAAIPMPISVRYFILLSGSILPPVHIMIFLLFFFFFRNSNWIFIKENIHKWVPK